MGNKLPQTPHFLRPPNLFSLSRPWSIITTNTWHFHFLWSVSTVCLWFDQCCEGIQLQSGYHSGYVYGYNIPDTAGIMGVSHPSIPMLIPRLIVAHIQLQISMVTPPYPWKYQEYFQYRLGIRVLVLFSITLWYMNKTIPTQDCFDPLNCLNCVDHRCV